MIKTLQISSELNNIVIVERYIHDLIEELHIRPERANSIMISVLEGVNNAIVHGNKSDRRKSVYLTFSFEENNFTAKIRDEGTGFSPDAIPNPTHPENIEKINGRGVFLMKSFADAVKFNPQGNEVIICFYNVR